MDGFALSRSVGAGGYPGERGAGNGGLGPIFRLGFRLNGWAGSNVSKIEAMQKWEYQFRHFKNTELDVIETIVQGAGGEGWELVQIVVEKSTIGWQGSLPVAIFKRPKQ
jgi:hypothetical protein